MNNPSKIIIQRLVFEGYERVCRFLLHLEDIDKQFYTNEESIIVDKKPFIRSYEQCLEDLFVMFLHCQKKLENTLSDNELFEVFHNIELLHIEINNLQSKWLIHLPRPNEPIELRRFIRVIQKQMVLYYKKEPENVKPISVFIKEGIGDEIFAVDPLKNYKLEELAFLKDQLKEILGDQGVNSNSSEHENSNAVHINISRLESNNPFHWPILLHEVSHSLMKQRWFKDNDIAIDFLDYLTENQIEFNIDSIFANLAQLKHWLTECWCDLFACALMGPAYYYSQHSSFLHSLSFNPNTTHPPYLFRLKLIEKFLNHRFKGLFQASDIENINSECEGLLEVLDKNNNHRFKHGSKLLNLLTYFKEYFLYKFPFQDDRLTFRADELNDLFNNIEQFVNDISHEKILELSSKLQEGLPIPGYTIDKSVSFVEKPNSIQEILYAGWYFRNVTFKDDVLREANGFDLTKTNSELFSLFKGSVLRRFQKLDQSMLHSIQVSEWFDLLVQKGEAHIFPEYKKDEIESSSLRTLVDKDILLYLQRGELKLIPLIDISKQLGSTSLDIRLGTTFEIYFPNQFGIVDFTNEDVYNKFKNNARKINLDFIEGIPINPGQFMLCHSMEYIKLPTNVSADLEGRSSFARLGLEIHMTAGFVDPGFEGVLTFEVFNAGINPVMLYPGLRIAQLRFTRISEPMNPYSKKHLAKYKGLLEYLPSRQKLDDEVTKIAQEKIAQELKKKQ